MKERLQKILSRSGVASRRVAEQMILAGRVTVNGTVAQLGQSADESCDVVAVDGVAVQYKPKKVYIMLHKPRGYVTTVSDEKGRRTVLDLVADCDTRVYPVGRLDMDSEGLLLLTNDGDLTQRLTHPSYETDKTYMVWIPEAPEDAVQCLSQPMTLDGHALRPAQVKEMKRIPKHTILLVTIHEGRNRQIRRMCEQCGMEVSRLRRISEGPLQLGKLAKGKWRYLTDKELHLLGVL